MGIDPIELRLRNAVRDGELSAPGERVRQSRVADVLETARREIRWDEPRPAGRGRGLAVEIRHVGGGKTSMRMRLLPSSGQVEVLTGMVDQGAGAHTVIRRVAAAAMSVARERIVVRFGDTGEAPQDPGAGGSRVTHVIGRQSGEWSTPWDDRISRRHVAVLLQGDRLNVDLLPEARNPAFYRGHQSDQFSLRAGDHFVIGQTTFTLADERVHVSLDLPRPAGERTFTAFDLRRQPTLEQLSTRWRTRGS